MKKLVVFLALALAGGLALAESAPEQTASAAVARWNAALKEGKLDALLELYAKDALVVLPNGQAAKDQAAIRQFWQRLLAKRSGRYTLDLDKVLYAHGDTVISTLRWSNLEGDLKYSYDGLIYSVFKRQPDGSWKAQVQRWN